MVGWRKLSEAAKKMILVICASSLVIIAAGVVYYAFKPPLTGAIPFAVGVALTSALNVLKVYMLHRAVLKSVDMGERGANYARLQNLLRFLLTGVVLVAAALTPFISVYGAAAGIFTFQIAALCIRFFKIEDFKDEESTADGG